MAALAVEVSLIFWEYPNKYQGFPVPRSATVFLAEPGSREHHWEIPGARSGGSTTTLPPQTDHPFSLLPGLLQE